MGLVFKNGGGLNPARPTIASAQEWLKTAYQEHDGLLAGLRTDFQFGFPALRFPLHRTAAPDRFPAIATVAVLFPSPGLRTRD